MLTDLMSDVWDLLMANRVIRRVLFVVLVAATIYFLGLAWPLLCFLGLIFGWSELQDLLFRR